MSDPYGVIDLASLKHDPARDDAPRGTHEVTVTEQELEDVIAASSTVATLLVVSSSRVPEGPQFLATLRRLVDAQAGALRLATVDADTQPRVAGALRVQNLPTVLLLVKGQLQPLFEGIVPDAELGPVIDQVVQLARQQGLGTDGVDDPADGEAPEEEPLSPLQQEAYDAIERGDLPGAVSAYEKLLAENPADDEARAGMATVQLMSRTQDADLDAARAAAAERPADLDAQLLVADLDVLGGHVDDAFARLLALLRGADAETRDSVRSRLLDLFEVVGAHDPRVAAARRRMANLLF
ncbi:tetratricopeptide repeat protein [Brachybacterium sp. AOP25-B2-12]|uniref:tetratricopeptide repeat protein n=1 Tax=Brachybacterium sp. AOP25-B2-12 TaxID=3457710 RepID=UPI0040345C79